MALSDAQWILQNPGSYSPQAVWNAKRQLDSSFDDERPSDPVRLPSNPLSTFRPHQSFEELSSYLPVDTASGPQDSGPAESQDQIGGFIPRANTPAWTRAEQLAASDYLSDPNQYTYTPIADPIPTAPITPSVQDWQKTATEPWGGTIQFTPGGAVYRKPEGWTYEQMQANQDVLMREGYYLNPEQFGQQMGIDIYEPGYVPGTYSPTQGVDPAFSKVAWDAVDQYPGQKAFRDHVRDIQIRNQQQAMIEQMALDMYGGGGFGGGFGGGGTFGGGFGGGIPPVVETGAYPTTPVFTGEPSFAGDPTPSDPFIDLADPGLGALASDAPAGTRDRLRSWLSGLGYTPQGVYGGHGETSWQRPTGATGPAAFTDADFNTLTDPSIQKWIRWLMGKMGYSAPTLYPGPVAP